MKVLAFDIFGTTVDWYTGVAGQVAAVAADRGVELDGGELASAWRERYIPSMNLVRTGELPWTILDELHRRSLDELLEERGVAGAFDDEARAALVRAWHPLPASPDAAAGLGGARARLVFGGNPARGVSLFPQPG